MNIDFAGKHLHLGCGNIRLPGFCNIDIVDSEAVDIVMDVANLVEIDDDSVESIYVCHVLDHISRQQIDCVLQEWNRVLKPEGLLRVAVSDFEKVCLMYQSGMKLERLWGHIVGGQKQPYDQHGCVFDYETLSRYLCRNRFYNIHRYNWRDIPWFNGDDYSRAYIPHKMFDDGILMSLNVEATKYKE